MTVRAGWNRTAARAAAVMLAVGCDPGPRDLPTVRLLDGRASETLRRTYREVAGLAASDAALRAESVWIDSTAAPLRRFWELHGARVVADVSDYTRTAWVETSLNVHFIRQGIGPVAVSLPLVIDLSPMGRVPPGREELHEGLLAWTLVHELVHRVRDQPYLARSTVGEEAPDSLADLVAGSQHDWDDLIAAFVMRDVLGDEAVRPLLFNRGLQRTVGVYRLDRFERRFLSRWRPSRERPLETWLRRSRDLDTGYHHPEAARRLEAALAGPGWIEAPRIRAAAEGLESGLGLGPDEVAQLLSDWEGAHGAGRLLAFPYRSLDGRWEWQESR